MSFSGDGFAREIVSVSFPNTTGRKETYSAVATMITLDGVFLHGQGERQDTAVVFMHPSGLVHHGELPQELARRGMHVLCAGSRYPHNDTNLIMEYVVADMGAWVRYLREERGYANVVLGGWSGGGSLVVYYQSQAERHTVTETPAGDPVDLTGLIPAQAVLQLSAHLSRATLLTESMDAAVVDERDPFRRDPALDLYADPPAVSPPYDRDFVAAYRAAQVERNRRITTWAKENLADLRKRGGPNQELPFVTYGTMADPRWLDVTLEPNQREAGVCYMGDPATMNNGPIGLGRFSTLRSWLSQWSIDDSNASTEKCGPDVSVPSLVVTAGADNGCPPSHTERILASLGGETSGHTVVGAGHYYQDQPKHLDEAASVCIEWLQGRELYLPSA